MSTLSDLIDATGRLTDSERMTLVMSVLRTLPKESLQSIVESCRGLTLTAPKVAPAQRRADSFYSAVSSIVDSRTGTSSPPLSVFVKTSRGSSVNAALKYVDEFIDSHFGGHLRLADRLQLYTLFANLLIDHLTNLNVPVSLGSVLSNHRSFPGLLDRAFPGYLNSDQTKHLLMTCIRATRAVRG